MSDNARTLPGGGVIDDRRSKEVREATRWLVVATDSFMSGWGRAASRSLFAVPCRDYDQAKAVKDNMRQRSEMKRARIVFAPRYRPHLWEGDHLFIRDSSYDDQPPKKGA